ncbi:uncharacterized protein JCM6883_003055 [Sporobolomyces salmoneus]|uniref:uncharacterized protein n=1 Tax=Sporobolomyces salmoneus TaxID=183962 RepID=UPI00316E9ACC
MPSVSSPPLVPLTDDELLDRSPFLTKLSRRRLAPIRLSQLLSSARSTKPPKEPEAWECCGSSCKPCVRELWREERKVWEECHPEGEGEEIESESEEEEEQKPEKPEKGGPQLEIGIESQVESLELVDGEPKAEEKGEEEGK